MEYSCIDFSNWNQTLCCKRVALPSSERKHTFHLAAAVYSRDRNGMRRRQTNKNTTTTTHSVKSREKPQICMNVLKKKSDWP